ncbi:MAG: hypothetical protein IJP09_02695 [Clostridia bacterium]|nr:hypothetical protein [Clostridia bacterium]
MFFKKKKPCHIVWGILIGTALGFAGASALALSNREVRKTMGKEWKKCCNKGSAMMNEHMFSLK